MAATKILRQHILRGRFLSYCDLVNCNMNIYEKSILVYISIEMYTENQE